MREAAAIMPRGVRREAGAGAVEAVGANFRTNPFKAEFMPDLVEDFSPWDT